MGVYTRVGKHATADEFIEDLKAKSKKREVGSPTRAHTHAHTTRTRTHTHMQAQQSIAAAKAAARNLKRAQRLVQDEEEVKEIDFIRSK